jgi:DNA helicase HerA-like ATPase
MSSAKNTQGRVGIWGASGSGKSAYTKKRLKGRKRVVVFDPLEEYSGKKVSTIKGVEREMVRRWADFVISYSPQIGKEAANLNDLSRFLLAVQRPFKEGKKGRPLTLVVEEMNSSFPVSGGAAKCPYFAEICSRGRHYGIEVFGVSQRLAEVDTRFRGNCTETVVFRQKGIRDKTAAAAEIGCAVSELPTENLHFMHERNGVVSKDKLTFAANSNRAPVAKKKRA